MTIPDKDIRLLRSAAPPGHRRPVMLAIAGDSAAGKTTLTRDSRKHWAPTGPPRSAWTTTTATTGMNAAPSRSPC